MGRWTGRALEQSFNRTAEKSCSDCPKPVFSYNGNCSDPHLEQQPGRDENTAYRKTGSPGE